MKVFISSVRRGLEAERDALPGLIRALGHEPRRFEDFTAQPVPSREACLAGVADADVYLLLLGPHYGTVFPETGLSPTHEEFVAARTAGIHRLVFRKEGVDFEPAEERFAKMVEEYGTGHFRGSFRNAVDLQPKVAQALRDLPPGALEWQALDRPVEVVWRSDAVRHHELAPAQLVVNAVPVPSVVIPRRELVGVADGIARSLRESGHVAQSVGLDVVRDESGVEVLVDAQERGGWNRVDEGGLLGCRVTATGQRSAWERLPADSLGAVLDREDLIDRVTRDLTLLGAVRPPDTDSYAFALELIPTSMTTIESVDMLGSRNSAAFAREGPARLAPDESASVAAFSEGAREVAAALVNDLLELFGRR